MKLRRGGDRPTTRTGATAAPQRPGKAPRTRLAKHRLVAAGTPIPTAQIWMRRAVLTGGIALCVLPGLASCMAVRAAQSTAAPQATPALGADAPLLQAQSTATTFVRQWQQTTASTASSLYALMVNSPSGITWPQKAGAPAAELEAVAVRAGGADGVWIVTVRGTGGSAGAGEWYDVPVKISQDATGSVQTGVLALPALVVAPAQLTNRGQDTTLQDVAGTSPAVQTSLGFLNAWLSASPSVARWTAPNSTIPAPTTTVCRQVQLVNAAASLADAQQLTNETLSAPGTPSPTPSSQADSSVRLSLNVVCTTPTTSRVARYRLALVHSNGQWAVQSLS